MENTNTVDLAEVLSVAYADRRRPTRMWEILPPKGVDISEQRERFFSTVDNLSESSLLDAREKTVIETWLYDGIRFDTRLWMISMGLHYNEDNLASEHAVITTLFIDCFNRADDVFDNFRTSYAVEDSRGGLGITTGSVRSTPILDLREHDPATVGEFITILHKLIGNSFEYADDKRIALESEFLTFFDTTTKAMEEYEFKAGSSVKYSFNEAKALRYQTLHPLVLFANKLFCPDRNMVASSQEVEMVALAMAAQWLDDRNDWLDDYHNGNVNMVLGLMADSFTKLKGRNQIEMKADEFFGLVDYVYGGYYPEDKTLERVLNSVEQEMREEYSIELARLHPRQKGFMPSVEELKLSFE